VRACSGVGADSIARDRKIFRFAGAHSTVCSDAFQVAAPPPVITIVRDYDTKPTAIKKFMVEVS
jgi:hypothetical protein